MMIGMLWFDNSKSLLSVKVQRATEYYTKKYGKSPDLCLVHPSMLDETTTLGEITIRPYRPVLPGHIWIGVDDETSQMGMEVGSKEEMDMERIEENEIRK